MNKFTPFNPGALTKHADGIAITSRTTNPIVDAVNNIMPGIGSHLGAPFLGQPVVYKLRGWKLPTELAGAFYWASKVQVGRQIIDPTKDVRLIFDWDNSTSGSGEGIPTYREPNLIVINPSDIVVYYAVDIDDEGEPLDPQGTTYFWGTRSGHSLGLGESDTGLAGSEIEFNIAYLIGQASVDGKIYDVAMAPRDDRWFVCKIVGKTETIASEETDLPAELYTAKMIGRHGKPSFQSANPKEWADLGAIPLEANCYFRNIETGGSTSSSGPAGHMLLDNIEIASGEEYEPLAIGYLSDFTYDGIPIIAGYCISSTECVDNDGSGSG